MYLASQRQGEHMWFLKSDRGGFSCSLGCQINVLLSLRMYGFVVLPSLFVLLALPPRDPRTVAQK